MTFKQLIAVPLMLITAHAVSFAQSKPLRLWYDEPAAVWEETLPLGNGRLGMMPDGGVGTEKIVLNDITLWSGAPQDANNYEAYKLLPQIRQLLAEGRNNEAQAIMDKSFTCTGKGSADVPFGCFQTLGNLELEFDYKGMVDSNIAFSDYERELSLNTAVAKTTYKVNGVTYTREYFTSFGDDVGLVWLRASQPGQLSLRITMNRPERATVSTAGTVLQMSGQLESGTDKPGMQYQAQVTAKLTGGRLTKDLHSLFIKDATEVLIVVSMGT
ncbi:MAG TPA: glycoside hydrolase family 95 protein, partial [Chitinophaga sp.]